MTTRIVIINNDKLESIREVRAGQPLDIAISGHKVDCQPPGEINAPSARIQTEGSSLSIIKTGTGHVLYLKGESVRGATLQSGEKVTIGDCQIYAFCGQESSATALSEDNLRLLFDLTKSLSLTELDSLLPPLLDKLMTAFISERGFILLKKKGSKQFEEAISSKRKQSF